MSPIHYSSKTKEWSTPKALFDRLAREFAFEIDVCATPQNAKCDCFYTKSDDAMSKNWTGICWMNPPYGYRIGDWVRRAYESAQRGATVVCLLPAKTETRWWWNYVLKADEIRFIKTRLRFGGCNVNAPFPSAIVVFKHGSTAPGCVWIEPTPDERGATCVTFTVGQVVTWPAAPLGLAQVCELRRTRVRVVYRHRRGRILMPLIAAADLQRLQAAHGPPLLDLHNLYDRGILRPRSKAFPLPPPTGSEGRGSEKPRKARRICRNWSLCDPTPPHK